MANFSGKGWFQKGHPPSGGRKPRAVEEAYLKAVVGAVPMRKWKAILAKAVEQAILGESKARRFLADLLVGRDPVLLRHLAAEVEQALGELRNEPRNEAEARPSPTAGRNGEAPE
jgi:hypothetical protein